MILATSLFNKALYLNYLKRFAWGSVIYFVALFLSTAMVFLLRAPAKWQSPHFNGISDSLLMGRYHIFPTILTFIVPTVAAALLFHTFHSEKQTTFFHSLPLNRRCIFITTILSGLTLMILPVLLNGLLLFIMSAFGGYESAFTILEVLRFIGRQSFMLFVLFSLSSFVGMLTGNTIAHLVLTYIFNFLPPLLIGTTCYILKQVLYGFTMNNPVIEWMEKYTPMIRFASNLGNGSYVYPLSTILLFLFVGVAFYVLTYLLYRSRQNETAKDVISFPILKPIFKYLMTTLATLGAYSILLNVSQGDLPAIITWLVLSSLIIYFSCEMLLKKSLKVIKGYRGYLGFAIAAFAISLFVGLDVLGFETFTPKEDQIAGVIYYNSANSPLEKAKILKESGNIETILSLHQQMIENREVDELENVYAMEFRFITYVLKNGRTIHREYRIPASYYEELYNRLYASKEFKESEFLEVFQFQIEDAPSITIANEIDSNFNFTLTKPEEIKGLFEAFKEDLLAISYTNFLRKNTILNTRLETFSKTPEHHSLFLTFTADYKNVLTFIKNRGIEEEIYPKADQVKVLSVSNVLEQRKDLKDERAYPIEKYAQFAEPVISITDPAEVNALLEQLYSGEFVRTNQEYTRYRQLFLGTNNNVIAFLNEDDLPEIVLRHLNRI